MKRVALLPHASFVHVSDIGPRGETILNYVQSVAQRIQERGDPGYRPQLHFDVYGTIGDAFTDTEIPDFLKKLDKESQIRRLHQIKKILASRRINVKIVADEWCNILDDIQDFADADAVDYVQVKTPDLGSLHNTIDAVMYCVKENIGCCLGGSANETDISARITTQVALATQPQFLLSKPGIGADEGLMILTNEMIRTLALLDNEG
ncbi:hypothetical protein PENVUL_c005G09297 [Penicillium vulpinum]|uniref:Methylaspartate ammonia-lyase C-terminal domain-containing protein n=1 Tax=Penicillium vulpinum TaxID=29845 RepID=A0A1V6S6R0_9EURO|nr:hypothetical protein PENVUL_c005G09297 [Penicillium vulpinum]